MLSVLFVPFTASSVAAATKDQAIAWLDSLVGSKVGSSGEGYFDFCQEHGIVPSMRRLANWLGYSYDALKRNIDKQTEVGKYLDKIKDAIKDNLEQAALVNAVNNISAMFILKSQYEYVETTKVQLEPSESMLGQPKSGDELAIHELDRLGRNKEEIKNELKWFKDHGVIVRILNVPTTLIDFQGQEWLFDILFICLFYLIIYV